MIAGLTSVISVLMLYTSLLILYFLWLTSWSLGKVTGGHIVVKIFLLEEKTYWNTFVNGIWKEKNQHTEKNNLKKINHHNMCASISSYSKVHSSFHISSKNVLLKLNFQEEKTRSGKRHRPLIQTCQNVQNQNFTFTCYLQHFSPLQKVFMEETGFFVTEDLNSQNMFSSNVRKEGTCCFLL